MLVNLQEILHLAETKKFCVPAFNVYNIETARGVINAAEKAKAPVILQMYSRLVTSGAAAYVAPALSDLAHKSNVPVCLHLDHGAGECEVIRSLRMGFTGIMIDASSAPLEQNIAATKAAVRQCAYVNVGVEGELGHIGKAADGDERIVAEYTHADEAERYVNETGVVALAVMVGTAHGRYKKAPVLDIERIAQIKKRTNVSLVLHGGSGVPDEQIRAAIDAGVRKMNFSTDLCYAFLDACRERDRNIVGIDLFMEEPIARVERFAAEKIRILGADTKA